MAVSGGRFGAAVACLGDVDNDNYGDVAVGAPYSATTEDNGSTGVVFIYYGGLSGLQAGRQPCCQIAENSATLFVALKKNIVPKMHSYTFLY